MLFTLTLDHIKVLVQPFQKTLYQILNHVYYSIPHFCFNKKLFIGGNCRMCLIEIIGVMKPIISCSTPVTPGLVLLTKTPFILKSRENILEFLLLNHPLDCAICDQGGECDLQEFTELYGQGTGRMLFFKSPSSIKSLHSLIITVMNRCINCTKCIRLGYYMGSSALSLLGRSKKANIYNVSYIYFSKKKYKKHELFSNLLDICPVSRVL
jgi:NADH dehydrogenase/NADH:ubiquinone oxidoreductase subunit G